MNWWQHPLVGKRQMEELLVQWYFQTWGSLKIPPIHLQYSVGCVVMTPSRNRTSTVPLILSLRPPDKKTPPTPAACQSHTDSQHTQGKQYITDIPSDYLSNIPLISTKKLKNFTFIQISYKLNWFGLKREELMTNVSLWTWAKLKSWL